MAEGIYTPKNLEEACRWSNDFNIFPEPKDSVAQVDLSCLLPYVFDQFLTNLRSDTKNHNLDRWKRTVVTSGPTGRVLTIFTTYIPNPYGRVGTAGGGTYG